MTEDSSQGLYDARLSNIELFTNCESTQAGSNAATIIDLFTNREGTQAGSKLGAFVCRGHIDRLPWDVAISLE